MSLSPRSLEGSAPGCAAIVGAGLGGVTAALSLLRQGWRVRVYEQAEVLGEVGAGISLSSGSGRALAALGLGPALLAASSPIPDIAFVHYRTGEVLAGALDHGHPQDRGFDASRHIHRADLHAILLRGVFEIDSDAVATGKRLTRVTQAGAGVQLQFADGSHAEADLLIGADGARSTVRSLMFNDPPPTFAGQIAFRCLIPIETAAPFMASGAAAVSIGAARVFNRYLIRGRTLVNVIGIAKSDRWRGEGWNTRATVEEFLQEFEGFHADVLGLIQRAPPQSLIKWGLFARQPLSHWSRGRVLLIGDAAHPILPFLGLGAALAIEDGVVLARTLSAFHDARSAFEAFQRVRGDRVETVRSETIRQGEIIQAAEPGGAAVARSPSQNITLFDYDPHETSIHV